MGYHEPCTGWATSRRPRWVDIVGDDNELGLLLLHECGDMVDAHLHAHWLLGGIPATSGGGLGSTLEALPFLGLCLRLEVVEETEELGRLTLVESVGELVDGRGDLDALEERHLAALKAHVLRPADKAGEIAVLGKHVSTNAECTLLRDDRRAGEINFGRGASFSHLL